MKRLLPKQLRPAFVYKIVHLATDRCYVGSTVDKAERWRDHKRRLVANKHHSTALQRAWNKYGPETFDFIVVERCFADVVLSREQSWIDNSDSVFNCAPVAGSVLGIRYKRPASFGENLAIINRARGKDHYARVGAVLRQRNKEKPVSQELRKKISELTRAGLVGKDLRKSESWKKKHVERMLTCHPKPWLGRKHSEETKAKMRAAWARRKAQSG